MSDLFDSAISAIQSGIQDYEADSAQRSLTAVRNIFAGIILLAKEALCSLAPSADPDLVLAEKIRMIPDGAGGIKVEKKGKTTIDVRGVIERFKDLQAPLPDRIEKPLSELQNVRNDIEHKHTVLTHASLKELIAKAFPIILYFLKFVDAHPPRCLGDAYDALVSVTESQELERARCLATFSNVDFPFGELDGQPFHCSNCHTELVEQSDPSNTDHEQLKCKCNLCREDMDAPEAVKTAINYKYVYELYKSGEQRVEECPECNLDCFVTYVGCVWCEATLGDCSRCGAGLTPNTTDIDYPDFCDYCGHMTFKDD